MGVSYVKNKNSSSPLLEWFPTKCLPDLTLLIVISDRTISWCSAVPWDFSAPSGFLDYSSDL